MYVRVGGGRWMWARGALLKCEQFFQLFHPSAHISAKIKNIPINSRQIKAPPFNLARIRQCAPYLARKEHCAPTNRKNFSKVLNNIFKKIFAIFFKTFSQHHLDKLFELPLDDHLFALMSFPKVCYEV